MGDHGMKRFLSLLAALCFVSGVARAEPSVADRATARSLAREGFDAQQRGHYAVAADRFSRADALVHAPTLLLGLARADVGLGKLVAAHEAYEQILREPLQPQAPAAFGKAVEDAKRELATLTPRLAWVTIHVGGTTSSNVTIDEVPVPVAALGIRRPCDPGSHVVKASAQGFASAERTFVVAEGAEQSVTLPMDPLPADAPLPVGTARPEPGAGTPLHTKLALVSFGIGAAGLITGSVAGILVLTKHSSLSGECADGCPSSDSGQLYTYRTLANLSTAAMIVAGAGAAAGVTLLLTGNANAKPVSAYLGPMSAGVIGTF
jgi:hypothetical protein